MISQASSLVGHWHEIQVPIRSLDLPFWGESFWQECSVVVALLRHKSSASESGHMMAGGKKMTGAAFLQEFCPGQGGAAGGALPGAGGI